MGGGILCHCACDQRIERDDAVKLVDIAGRQAFIVKNKDDHAARIPEGSAHYFKRATNAGQEI